MKFINREKELEALGKRFNSKNFEFCVIYGRRRIGKTTLSLAGARGREFVYYLATEENNLKKFKDVASKLIPEIKYVQEDMEAIFSSLKGKIVIIDEFPNLIKESPKAVSELQRIIDVVLKKTKTKLVVLGSSISMMEDRVLSYHSPLYGRKTSQIKLKPLKFSQIKNFFPKASSRELIEIYGFADGIPFYLEKIDYPFWKYLDGEMKKVDSFLKTEIDFLMKYEFSEARTYKKILEAIALGNTKLGEIKNYIGFKGTDITPYLKNLMETEFVERAIPLLDTVRSRKGRYYIKDNFVNFWFRFIYPNLSFIEEEIFSSGEIREKYDTYLGFIFERICKEFLVEKKGKLPIKFSKIGKQWGAIPKAEKGENQYEIDLVILNDEAKQILFAECKWRALKEKQAKSILGELKEKSGFVRWNNGKRKEFFGLIAKRIENKKKLRKEGFLVFDLEDF